MHVRFRFAAAAAAALCATGALVPAVTASAASPRHCVAQAPTDGAAPTMRCYRTFAAAIAAASNGRIQLDPNTPAELLPPAAVAANTHAARADGVSPLTTVIIGIDYTSTGYSGSSFTWYQSANCGNYYTSSMPSGWNDVIESAANYSGCGTTLYHDINFGGSTTSIGVDGSASTLGSFNNQASSQRWCPSNSC
jgi:hypothetical protein